MEQSEKLKISSDFIFPKIILTCLVGTFFISLTDYKRTETKDLVITISLFLLFSYLLFFIFTRPKIYYDNNNLYIIKGNTMNIVVPLVNIKSIKLLLIGFGPNGHSYKLKYRNTEYQLKSIRIFPSYFSSSFSEFIKTVKNKSSNVDVRNWSIGFNEFFD